MPLRALVVNRVLPASLLDAGATAAATALSEGDRTAIAALQGGERLGADAARRLGEAFLVLHRLAERDERQVQRLSAFGRLPVSRLPLAEREVVDIEGLVQLSRLLGGG